MSSARDQLKMAIRDTIVTGVYQQNFRNGIFKDSISRSTSAIDALDVLLSSAKLSTSEKAVVKNCRNAYIACDEHSSRASIELISFCVLRITERVCDMFRKDERDRGLYVPVPPITNTLQVLGKDGTISTISLDPDNHTPTVTKGG